MGTHDVGVLVVHARGGGDPPNEFKAGPPPTVGAASPRQFLDGLLPRLRLDFEYPMGDGVTGGLGRVSQSTEDPVSIDEAVPFEWTCPKCSQPRIQGGYTRGHLRWSLHGGHKIDAYCAHCDALWAIGPHERAEIARALGSEKNDAPTVGADSPPVAGE